MIVYFVSFFFYLIATYVCFLAYREFKAIAYETEGVGPNAQQRYDEEA